MSARILVVDDEPHFERLMLQRFRKKVRSKEYDFVFAQNGIEALNKLRELKDIDIVLTDINMPRMDGLTFLSKLNDVAVKVKAVMVSAYGDMENIRAAMNLGAYDFVTKPIIYEDLEITINKALREIETLRLAERTRQQLDNLQQELAVASEIQQSILPKNFDIFPADCPFNLYAEMIPAKDIGGDFYDFFFIDEDHLALVIGDVSGKGTPAALFMAISRTLLRAIGLKSKSVSKCLGQVNALLSQDNPTSMFVTVFYAVLNIRTGQLEYCSGGHNPPWIIKDGVAPRALDDSQHVALGVVEHFEYHSRVINLEPGATLVLYTDGITEAVNVAEEFFDEKLQVFLEGSVRALPAEIVQEVIGEVGRFSAGRQQSDDITMMALQMQTVS